MKNCDAHCDEWQWGKNVMIKKNGGVKNKKSEHNTK